VRAYEGGAKGCTTFRIDGKRMGILTTTKEEEAPSQELSCSIDPATGRRSCE
jgi:ribonucleoside-diphosphate reductase alpha chain